MSTEERKNEIMSQVSSLFCDTNADEAEQIEALEEIKELCSDNIDVLMDQLRQR